jgi:hypothetical protein
MFRARALKKTYWALAQGRVKPAEGAPLPDPRGGSAGARFGARQEIRDALSDLNAWRTTTELESTS